MSLFGKESTTLKKDRSILCYGDSNTWGANPADLTRFPRSERWSGRLQQLLGSEWTVIEEGLPNRTSAFEDPLIPFRRGDELFPEVLETHSPVDLVVVMLGTNDPKNRVAGNPADAVEGIGRISTIARGSGARVLVVAPPRMTAPIRFEEFEPGVSLAYLPQLAAELESAATRFGFEFLDASSVVSVSPLDGVHLDAEGHRRLAEALAARISGRLA